MRIVALKIDIAQSEVSLMESTTNQQLKKRQEKIIFSFLQLTFELIRGTPNRWILRQHLKQITSLCDIMAKQNDTRQVIKAHLVYIFRVPEGIASNNYTEV